MNEMKEPWKVDLDRIIKLTFQRGYDAGNAEGKLWRIAEHRDNMVIAFVGGLLGGIIMGVIL